MLRNIWNYSTHSLQLYLLTLRESQITRLSHILVHGYNLRLLCQKLLRPYSLPYIAPWHVGSLVDDFRFSKWYILSEPCNNLLRSCLILLSFHPLFHSDNSRSIKFLLLPHKRWWFLSDCYGMQGEQLHQTFKTLLLYPLNHFLTFFFATVFTNLFHLVLIRNYKLYFIIPLCSFSFLPTITSFLCLYPGTHTGGTMQLRGRGYAYTSHLNVPNTILTARRSAGTGRCVATL